MTYSCSLKNLNLKKYVYTRVYKLRAEMNKILNICVHFVSNIAEQIWFHATILQLEQVHHMKEVQIIIIVHLIID